MHYIRIWSSRTGNVLHSSRESAFVCLLFNKVEEVQHSIVIPSDSHSGINYPPFANANGFETTDCLECLQILNILIYGRRVCFKAGDWTLCIILGYGLPEREAFCMLPLISFCIFTLCKNRTFCFTPAIPTGFHSSEPKAHFPYTLSIEALIPAGITHSVFVPRLPVMVSLFHIPLAK